MSSVVTKDRPIDSGLEQVRGPNSSTSTFFETVFNKLSEDIRSQPLLALEFIRDLKQPFGNFMERFQSRPLSRTDLVADLVSALDKLPENVKFTIPKSERYHPLVEFIVKFELEASSYHAVTCRHTLREIDVWKLSPRQFGEELSKLKDIVSKRSELCSALQVLSERFEFDAKIPSHDLYIPLQKALESLRTLGEDEIRSAGKSIEAIERRLLG